MRVPSPNKEKRRRRKEIHQVQFAFPIYSLEHGQIPSVQPLKDS